MPKTIIILITTLTLFVTAAADCAPQFMLPNMIKDIAYFEYTDANEVEYSTTFFARMFTGTAVAGYGFSQLDISGIGQNLNYYLDVKFSDFDVKFFFNVRDAKWSLASVSFWITSRVDIVVVVTTLLNVQPNQKATQNIVFPTAAQIDANSQQVNFIVGMYSIITQQNLTVSVSSGPLTATGGLVAVEVGTLFLTNVTVCSIVYSPSNGQFASNGGSVTYKSFTTQRLNLFKNMLPIYYYIFGVSSFSLTGNNIARLQFGLLLKNASILNAKTQSTYDFFSVSYLTVGLPPISVCQGCSASNIIYDNNCWETCPTGTYVFNFPTGGKACLQCLEDVGQRLNELSNGCSCLPGYEILTNYQCVASGSAPSACQGANLVQNGTSCICAPNTYNISGVCGSCTANTVFMNGQCVPASTTQCKDPNSAMDTTGTCVCNSGFVLSATNECQPTCPENASYNPSTKFCQCNYGFGNYSSKCVACTSDQYYDAATLGCKCIPINQVTSTKGICECQSNYYNISGSCSTCPSGTSYKNGICTPDTAPPVPPVDCGPSKIYKNGECVCDNTSIAVGSLCISCSMGTFANKGTNLCDNCVAFCEQCINKISCNKCKDGYSFDGSTIACLSLLPKVKMVEVQNGFPVYTSTAIVTDFKINTTLTTLTRNQVARIVKVSFPDTTTVPNRIIYVQHPEQTSVIRISFIYRELPPMTQFTANYAFSSEVLSISQVLPVEYLYQTGKTVHVIN